jgi:peptide deformylase
MELVETNNPILTTVCEEYQFEDPPFDPVGFAKDLVKTMRDLSGIGLSAPQVGFPYRVFAIRADPNKVFFNPTIVWYSDNKVLLEEGCLSTPGLFIPIERSQHIKIRYRQPNGETLTETFTGMTARVCQHENNHLDGILFTHLVSRLKLDRAIKKCYKEKGIKYSFTDLYKRM